MKHDGSIGIVSWVKEHSQIKPMILNSLKETTDAAIAGNKHRTNSRSPRFKGNK